MVSLELTWLSDSRSSPRFRNIFEVIDSDIWRQKYFWIRYFSTLSLQNTEGELTYVHTQPSKETFLAECDLHDQLFFKHEVRWNRTVRNGSVWRLKSSAIFVGHRVGKSSVNLHWQSLVFFRRSLVLCQFRFTTMVVYFLVSLRNYKLPYTWGSALNEPIFVNRKRTFISC